MQAGQESKAPFQQVLEDDAAEAARRTLRHKFGRLSNRRIVSLLRSAAGECADGRLSDRDLLDRWFAAYERYLREYKRLSGSYCARGGEASAEGSQ